MVKPVLSGEPCMSEPDIAAELASRIAGAIRDGFEQYHARFAAITARARQRFEQRDWAGARQDAVERSALYALCIAEQMDALRRLAGADRCRAVQDLLQHLVAAPVRHPWRGPGAGVHRLRR
ncbi:hypothetical protein G6F32_015541 [Rhizopus arrhizus]|nr:hypothetical protein G6F32_015541 [Rhizopus arrhizus]